MFRYFLAAVRVETGSKREHIASRSAEAVQDHFRREREDYYAQTIGTFLLCVVALLVTCVWIQDCHSR